MRPTPETDAECAHRHDAYEIVNPPEWEWVVTADFARKLERERDEAREALQRISDRPVCPVDVRLESSKDLGTKTAPRRHHDTRCYTTAATRKGATALQSRIPS